MSIKWEVGKKYRTRSGKWAICAAIIGPHPTKGDVQYPIVMHHEDGETEDHISSGRWTDGGEHDRDIIGEWVAPLAFDRLALLLESTVSPGCYATHMTSVSGSSVGQYLQLNGRSYVIRDVQRVTLTNTPEATCTPAT